MRYTIRHHTTAETLTLSRDLRTEHPAWVHEQLGTDSEAELQAALDQYGDDAAGRGPDADGVALVAEMTTATYDEDYAEARLALLSLLGDAADHEEHKHREDVLTSTWCEGMTVAEWVDAVAARCSPTEALRQFVTASGLTPTELSRVLGRDDRTMRRWLSGEQDVPDTLAAQLGRLRVTEVTRDTVWLAYRR
jgi:hypothetical protein